MERYTPFTALSCVSPPGYARGSPSFLIIALLYLSVDFRSNEPGKKFNNELLHSAYNRSSPP